MVGKIFISKKEYNSGFHTIPKGLKIKIVGTNTSTDTSEFPPWDYRVEVINDIEGEGFLRKGKEYTISAQTLKEEFIDFNLKNNVKKL